MGMQIEEGRLNNGGIAPLFRINKDRTPYFDILRFALNENAKK
jgi:hypothetical protein